MLTFKLFGVPVGVHVSFLLIALLGYPEFRGWEIAAWTSAVFLAVLLHEAGHAFTARAFGAHPVQITLFALGGVTTYPDDGTLGSGRRFAISAAGSSAGIVVGGALWALVRAGVFDGAGRLLRVGIGSFVFASLVWGVLNWIPIKPLDGSHMVRSVLDALTPDRASVIANVISVGAGVVAIALALNYRFYFAALFAAFLVLSGLRSDEPRPSESVTGAGEAESADDLVARSESDPETPRFPI